jgi:hypothetical protein
LSSLSEELQQQKTDIIQFKNLTVRVLRYIPDVLNEEAEHNGYIICSSIIAGTKKSIRPFKKNLFIRDHKIFEDEYNKFEKIIERLKKGERIFNEEDHRIINRVVYTIQQSAGIGLDLMVESNSARKHVGNRFEEFIRSIFNKLNLSIKKVVLCIPYATDEGEKNYKCETEIVISPYDSVRSDSQNIDPKEIVISLKTTTKDRMPKIFIDKILMERFVKHPVKVVGISQNDIQRKDDGDFPKISHTFVSNLFMVYTQFLTQLEGYYYVDIPPRALESPFNQHIFPFSKFLLEDLWNFLRS